MNIKIKLDDFNTKMHGLTDYADGFITTLIEGENKIAESVAEVAQESAYLYIDSMARVYPERLHHVYEWGRSGDSNLRLFTLSLNSIAKNKYQITSTFLDSNIPTPNSNQIFKNKALVMEVGKPITIKPKTSKVLVFEVDGETIFTPNEVRIPNPGGDVSGEFANAMQSFQTYFKSTFITSSLGLKIKKIGLMFKPGRRPSRSAGKAAALNFIMGLKQL